MRVDPKRYAKAKAHSPVAVNIRIRRHGRHAKPATRVELLRVLRQAAETGIIADGWEIAYVDWEHGEGKGWRSGTIDDLAKFQALVQSVAGSARIARVPKEDIG